MLIHSFDLAVVAVDEAASRTVSVSQLFFCGLVTWLSLPDNTELGRCVIYNAVCSS